MATYKIFNSSEISFNTSALSYSVKLGHVRYFAQLDKMIIQVEHLGTLIPYFCD